MCRRLGHWTELGCRASSTYRRACPRTSGPRHPHLRSRRGCCAPCAATGVNTSARGARCRTATSAARASTTRRGASVGSFSHARGAVPLAISNTAVLCFLLHHSSPLEPSCCVRPEHNHSQRNQDKQYSACTGTQIRSQRPAASPSTRTNPGFSAPPFPPSPPPQRAHVIRRRSCTSGRRTARGGAARASSQSGRRGPSRTARTRSSRPRRSRRRQRARPRRA